ncbi:hypothetical protein IC582_027816 [Cucumis melo]
MGEGNREEEPQTSNKHGGWITFPFIIGSFACMTLATGGWLANLIVYLIKEYNISSIDATLIFNIVNGCLSVFPVVGAVLADSFFGSFFIIVISTSISLLVMFFATFLSFLSLNFISNILSLILYLHFFSIFSFLCLIIIWFL